MLLWTGQVRYTQLGHQFWLSTLLPMVNCRPCISRLTVLREARFKASISSRVAPARCRPGTKHFLLTSKPPYRSWTNNAVTRDQVKAIYDLHKGRYGYRRITATLRRQGNVINHKTVQRLMEELQLKSPGVFTARSSAAPDLSVRHEMQDARCRSARALAAQPTCHAAGQHRTRSQRS